MHYDTLLRIIQGRLNGKRGRGGPRRTWVDDLRDWTGSKRYDQTKRADEIFPRLKVYDCAWCDKSTTIGARVVLYIPINMKPGSQRYRHGNRPLS